MDSKVLLTVVGNRKGVIAFLFKNVIAVFCENQNNNQNMVFPIEGFAADAEDC